MDSCSLISLIRGSRGRSTGRAREDYAFRQLFPPVLEALFRGSPFQPLPLPQGIVCVLDGQFRQRSRLVFRQRCVQGAQLEVKNPHRPSVRHDVMHRKEKHMIVRTQS